MPTPILESEPLRLRPLARADAADIFAYAANPNVTRYMSWPTHRRIADSHAFIEMVLARGPSEPTWAICLRDTPPVIGVIEFGPCDALEAEIHYVLAEPFWNQGLMTEAVRTVLAWALEHCPGVQVVASCAAAQNVGSQRVMQKNGLVFDRVQFDRWLKASEPVEQHYYKRVCKPAAAG